MKCFVDIESSGFVPFKHEALTASFILTDEKLREIDEKTFKFRPECKHTWSEDAAAIHGFTWDNALLFPDKKSSTTDLINWLYSVGDSYSFICHALSRSSRLNLFDYQHLFALFWEQEKRSDFYRLFPEQKVQTTMLRSKKEAQQRYGIDSQRLESWAKKLGIDNTLHHQSEHDTRVCLEIYKYQQEVTLK